jgi:hypothetical protein
MTRDRLAVGATGERVRDLQLALVELGQTISEQELRHAAFGADTHRALLTVLREYDLEPNGDSEAATLRAVLDLADAQRGGAKERDDYLVYGTIINAGAKPLSNVSVHAFDKSIRHQTPLGSSTTDSHGKYKVFYKRRNLHVPARGHADLFIQIGDDASKPLGESSVVFNAPRAVRIDLQVQGVEPSEFEQIVATLTPFLDDVAIADLSAADTSYLASESGLDARLIGLVVQAEQPLSGGAKIDAQVLYGLFRESLADLPSIATRSADQLRTYLLDAIAKNYIAARFRDTIDSIIKELQSLAGTLLLTPPANPQQATLGTLAGKVLTTSTQQQTFAQLLVQRTGTSTDFWNSVKQAFPDPAVVAKLQLAFRVGAIAATYQPLVDYLLDKKQITSTQDLAGMQLADWQSAVAAVGFPSNIPGATSTEQKQNYAWLLYRALEDSIPTPMVAAAIKQDSTLGGQADLVQFFKNTPGFEFGADHVDNFIAKTGPGALTGVADPATLKTNLQKLQRVFKITPRYSEIKTLVAAGLDTAQRISRMPKSLFVSRFAATIGTDRAAAVYDSAVHQASSAMVIQSLYDARLNPNAGTAIQQTIEDIAILPNWKDLFPEVDYCACTDCLAVDSPAAYLVDLLTNLQDPPFAAGGGASGTAFQAMDARRPEIKNIPLNCENTNVTLPYIDIVNEILENAIAPSGASPSDTTLSADELRITPQYLNEAPYEGVQPNPPARSYLADIVFPWALPFALGNEVARAYLGQLGVPRYSLMAALGNQHPASAAAINAQAYAIAQEYFGMSTLEWNVLANPSAATPPRLPIELWGGTPMSTVTDFLQRSELSIDEFFQFQATAFVTSNGGLSFQPPDICDTDQMQLQALSDAQLSAFATFLRLRRRLGWTIPQTDGATTALFHGDWQSFLVELHQLRLLQDEFSLPLDEILSWWSPLVPGTDTAPNLYDRLFRSRSVPGGPDPAFSLTGTATTIELHVAGMLAGLQIKEADLDLLLNGDLTLAIPPAIPLSATAAPSHDLTLANLSALFRIVSLSRVLGLSVRDFQWLRVLIGRNPFQAAATPTPSPAATRAFVDAVGKHQATGFSVAMLDYLLTQDSPATAQVGPSNASLAQQLDTIRLTLFKASADPLADSAAQSKKLHLALVQSLANLFSIDATVVEAALGGIPSLVNPATANIEDDLLPLATVEPTTLITPTANPTQFQALYLLAKIATIVNQLALSASELAWKLGTDSTTQLNLGTLPPAGKPVSFDQWASFVSFVTLQRSLPAGAPALVDIVTAPSASAALGMFATRTGVKSDEMAALASQLNLDPAADYADGTAFVLLKAALDLLKRLGTTTATASAWISADVSIANAKDIQKLVKSKYDESTWPAVGTALEDPLRQRRRDALVAQQLTAHPGITTANQLFEYYLIDVEMNPCQQTSRVAQAIGSAQLFIQRCLMNLEPGIALNQDIANWWSWMRNYRVWQANRAVFLYPENWIYPELRNDRTPLFQALQSQLKKKEITDANVTDAYLAYLDGLHQVARLEIVATYEERVGENNNSQNVFHVIGRTFSTPKSYFYRKQTIDSWTPWEAVDADIEGDYLMAVVYNRRLRLIWGIINTKSPDTSTVDPNSKTPPPSYREVGIAWSDYVNGGWTTKKQTDTTKVVVTVAEDTTMPPPQFLFRTILPYQPRFSDFVALGFGSAALIVECYRTIYTGDGQGWIDSGVAGFGFLGCVDDITVGSAILQSTTSSDSVYYLKFIKPPVGAVVSNMKFVQGLPDDSGQPQPYELQDGFTTTVLDPQGNTVTTTLLVDIPVLRTTAGPFKLVPPAQDQQFASQGPFFFEDAKRTFLVTPIPLRDAPSDAPDPGAISYPRNLYYTALYTGAKDPIGPLTRYVPTVLSWPALTAQSSSTGNLALAPTAADVPAVSHGWAFESFYHPYVCDFINRLETDGLSALLARDTQETQDSPTPDAFFVPEYNPVNNTVFSPYPQETVDFSLSGPYGLYNWELFFHVPLFIAEQLSRNQQFEAAQKWFHFIFDPTSGDPGAVERFWRFLPFYQLALDCTPGTTTPDQCLPIQWLLAILDYSGGNSAHLATQTELQTLIQKWKGDPFDPFLIARFRMLAFQKAVVMAYLDNLFAWGDYLFSQETNEAINEATQIYIMAANILGDRPRSVPRKTDPPAKSFSQLVVDAFGNAQVEGILPPSDGGGNTYTQLLPLLNSLYFCVPPNSKLLGYWDTLADRLFKIRNCMNIQGQVRQLPLFAPPIDPALLVQAAAAGVDLQTILAQINAALPNYRFTFMVQKAIELCNEVRSLGVALLSALEKQDGEQLATLRSGQEVAVLTAVRDVKVRQVKEAEQNLAALTNYQTVVQDRINHYSQLIQAGLNSYEQEHFDKMSSARNWALAAAVQEVIAGVLHAVPNFDLGISGAASSPVVTATWGGANLGAAIQATGRMFSIQADADNYDATVATIQGGYARRLEDWQLQLQIASDELKQVGQQLLAAQTRIDIANTDLANQDLQIQNAKDVDSFLRNKFTNQDLYSWMIGQISEVYFQSYQLAYDTAKRAEKAFQVERADYSRTFLQPAYWDNLKQGLLAGDKLALDLRRMELAFVEDNRREYEITRHVSLQEFAPDKLRELTETGLTTVTLPETLFDADYPGHYMRRLKAVSISVPGLAGPYTNINCTLTLLNNYIRVSTDLSGGYVSDPAIDTKRFLANPAFGGVQTVVTSSGQADSGMFEVNLRDERFLPFEGAGAISTWQIAMPQSDNQFDIANTVNDVILHLRYTAREGGEDMRTQARAAAARQSGLLLVSARHDFADAWQAFVYAPATAPIQLAVDLAAWELPLPVGRAANLTSAIVFFKFAAGFAYDNAHPLPITLTAPDGTVMSASLSPIFADSAQAAITFVVPLPIGTWTITIDENALKAIPAPAPPAAPIWVTVGTPPNVHYRLNPDVLEDVGILLAYQPKP